MKYTWVQGLELQPWPVKCLQIVEDNRKLYPHLRSWSQWIYGILLKQLPIIITVIAE